MNRRLVSLKLFALCVVALALIGCPERENVPADYVGLRPFGLRLGHGVGTVGAGGR